MSRRGCFAVCGYSVFVLLPLLAVGSGKHWHLDIAFGFRYS
jgi:hypothetical protein